MNRKIVATFLAFAALLPLQAEAAGGVTVTGAGETIITGGTGGSLTELKPVKSIFAFRVTKPEGGVASGRFECLALVPSAASGAASGEFTENVMYVTGVVNKLIRISRDTVRMEGQGRCSGLGAGETVKFQATVKSGGPGATIRLTVDTLPGIEFFELVTQGSIKIVEE